MKPFCIIAPSFVLAAVWLRSHFSASKDKGYTFGPEDNPHISLGVASTNAQISVEVNNRQKQGLPYVLTQSTTSRIRFIFIK